MEFLVDTYFDALKVGDIQTTRGRTITESDIVNWCALTGDWFVLHSDKEYAARSMFGQRIAPGMMVLAFSGGLGVPPISEAVVANYGGDRIRYPRPTLIGDTVHVEIEVEELRPRDGETGVASFRWDVLNQNGETVVSSRLKVLLRRAPDVS
ncbi:MaoC family dehydratase [Nocardia gipuzkoensis]|uniref:MaoC family dehydratase n=1 Tax=Nocardia gipuzkoensis TaxID=2749991 RepID=UPI00237D89E9|nr:MaoC/PaaZ C-terminal domain-containing protein [Nocardia gipuzkoensis]MDE1675265.1 MaoC/PaaZ C-terminal domain-containing protein [Nocardia gipuzkoensis]